jgi:peptidoglycan/xylan/chitin deacetylase (PgdA/CDA1 family)
MVGEVLSTLPPQQRDIVVESFFEYGSRIGVWRILDILAEHHVPATFFLCGLAGERNPAVAKAIVEGGHEPSGHGYNWHEHHLMTEEQQREDIRKCVVAIQKLTGERPVGWLNRYAPSPMTRALLAEEGGFIYDNNAYNDDLPYYVPIGPEKRPWLILPYSMELNDARCWRGAMLSVGEYEEFLINALEQLHSESRNGPKMMSVGLHCRITGTPGRVGVLRRFIQRAKQLDVWFARRDEIAKWWLKSCPPQ